MDQVDRVSNRVGAGALAGFLGGTAYGALKGHPVGPTAFKVALSFTMVGTALFVPERMAYLALESHVSDERSLVMTSHAFAGVAGGGLNGYLYQKKPLRGMVYFVPLMLGLGLLELAWEKRKKERISSLRDTDQTQNTEELQQ